MSVVVIVTGQVVVEVVESAAVQRLAAGTAPVGLEECLDLVAADLEVSGRVAELETARSPGLKPARAGLAGARLSPVAAFAPVFVGWCRLTRQELSLQQVEPAWLGLQ